MIDYSDLSAKPTAERRPRRQSSVQGRTVFDLREDGSVELEVPATDDAEGTALRFLKDEGLNPSEWQVTNYRKIEYGKGMTSVRFSFKRTGARLSASLSDAELDTLLSTQRAVKARQNGSQEAGEGGPAKAYLVALGDMQFGKDDGDGLVGTIARTMNTLDEAAIRLAWHRKRYDVQEIVVAFLGDHIEGFNSQGGANAWRTSTPLTEQIRVTRRIMLYAMQLFAGTGLPVRMVAVPGNHGEAVRFEGNGITRYDDSHDTECLIAVADAAALASDAYGKVKFYVPETDELSVALDLSGTNVVFTHGHKIKPGKHHEWVKGQAYNRDSLYRDCDAVFCGHYHYFMVEESSDRAVVQVPTLEGGSQWWKHLKGDEASQGLVACIVGQGRIDHIEVVR